MSKSSILSAIKRKTTEALKNFVHVEGQSIMKQVAAVGAKEAGVTDVHNDKFNGELRGAYFSVLTPTVKEDHWFVKKSALLEYIIVRTYPSDVTKKETMETVYSVQMPQKPRDGFEDGGEAGSSKSTSSKK